MYNQWKHLCFSRDFLIALTALSKLVRDYKKAQHILIECKRERMRESGGGRKDWILSDVKSAVSKAKALGYGQDVAGTTRAPEMEGVVQEIEMAGCNTPDSARQRETRKRTRSAMEFDEVEELSRTAGCDGTGNARVRCLSDVADRLVGFFGAGACDYIERRTHTTRTPGTTSQQLPPTPSSAAPFDAEPFPILGADNSDSSSNPLDNEEVAEQNQTFVSAASDQQAPEDNPTDPSEAHHTLPRADIAEDTQQIILRADAPPEYTDDERTDVLLQSFNPDPSVWYIAPTQTMEGGRVVNAALPDLRRVECLPKVALVPMRSVDETQHTLIVLDRTRAHGLAFDAGGRKEAAESSWNVAKDLLARMGILQREASVDFNPFPSVRASEDVSHGIVLIIVALNQLHEKKISRVSPRLWRILLAGFFPNGCETSQERLSRLLADLTKSTSSESAEDVGIEGNVEDAEFIDAMKRKAQSYAEEARLLLAMTESQLQRIERRKHLDGVYEWLSAKPDHTGPALDRLTLEEKIQVESELRTLPDISDQCEHQLHLLKTVCQHAAAECEQASLVLEARRKAVLQMTTAKYELLGTRLRSLYG